MEILVLLKQVPANLRVTLDGQFCIERDLAENMLNPADKTALYTALRLCDSEGGSVSCLTMGPPSAADCLREAAMQGADTLYHLCDKRLAGADSYVTALALRRAADSIRKFDLILCGPKTVDGETGQVGPELAEMLQYACLTNVTDAAPSEPGELLCRKMTEREEQICRVRLPALIAICGVPVPNRLPTLAQIRRAREKSVQTMDAVDIGFPRDYSAKNASPTRVVRMYEKPDGRRRCRRLDSADVLAEKLKMLAGETS